MRKLTHEEIASKRAASLSAPKLPVRALLESVRSLYNVGSIFRTSDGAGIDTMYLCGFTPHPPRKEIEKTALGATSTVNWEFELDAVPLIKRLRREGFTIACLELTDKSIPHTAIKKKHFPLCLVLGNEITGVSDGVIAQCDLGIEIPMHGSKQSLNVAVAYGIAVFELGRIWRQGV